MKTFRIRLSIVLLFAVMHMGIAISPCSANFNFTLDNAYRQDRIDSHIENLDREKFRAAGYTTDWSSVKTLRIYQLGATATWEDPCYHLFAHGHARYGWMCSGNRVDYPLNWKVKGHTEDLLIEMGYVVGLSNFDFIPLIGYTYDVIDYKLKNQHNTSSGPVFYTSKKGNKTRISLYTPFIGFDVRFKENFCCCYDFDFIAGYQFHYGSGDAKETVRKFFVTDDPASSNYGSKVKYHNVVGHQFHVGGLHSFCESWELGLGVEYVIFYNTHSNHVKLQHNKKIVQTGQFTHSQYHVQKIVVLKSFSINVSLGYRF